MQPKKAYSAIQGVSSAQFAIAALARTSYSCDYSGIHTKFRGKLVHIILIPTDTRNLGDHDGEVRPSIMHHLDKVLCILCTVAIVVQTKVIRHVVLDSAHEIGYPFLAVAVVGATGTTELLALLLSQWH